MRILIGIIAAAVVDVVAILVMNSMGVFAATDTVGSNMRPAIAGALAGLAAIIASSGKPKK
jgi:hypothetical protein